MKYSSREEFIRNAVGLATVTNNDGLNTLEVFGAIEGSRLRNFKKNLNFIVSDQSLRGVQVGDIRTKSDYKRDFEKARLFYFAFPAISFEVGGMNESEDLIDPVKEVLLNYDIIMLRESTLTMNPGMHFDLNDSLKSIGRFVDAKLCDRELSDKLYFKDIKLGFCNRSLETYNLMMSVYKNLTGETLELAH